MEKIEKKDKKLTFASMLKGSLYKNRDIIYDVVPPTGFVHRTDERNQLIMELSPILMNSAVSSVFIYGTPGTGKTGLMFELMKELETEAKKNKVKLKSAYVNCSEKRTETIVLIEILSELTGKEYPKVGWTRAKAVSEFIKVLDEIGDNILVILDEVDYTLRESGDDILYRLSRVNSQAKSNLSTVLISNDIKVGDYIKPKTASTLGRVRVIFSPYTSEELFDILNARAKSAFKANTISDAVLKKVGEIESARGGDARKALELMDACAKLAMSKKRNQVTLDLVDDAYNNLEQDTAIKTLTGLAKHQKLLYLALLKGKTDVLDGKGVYKSYLGECSSYNEEPLSERRIRSFLVEFGELGLIESEVGWLKDLRKKSRKITLNLDKALKNKVRKMLRDTI